MLVLRLCLSLAIARALCQESTSTGGRSHRKTLGFVWDYSRTRWVVTKDELFAAVWPETVVSDAALASCIQELRQALRDDAKRPRYIVTVHRRGFQFVAPVAASAAPVSSSKFQVSSSLPPPAPNPQHPTPILVGRERELAQLQGWFTKALSGERQVVFVTGEPGIGKTTLVEAFLKHVGAHGDAPGVAGKVWIGRGQCVEHYGAGEAYLPVLEALGRLCREAEGEEVIALLRQQAPTWLVQMPSLLSTVELEELQRRTAGVTRERMLRELAEAVEAITLEHALLLWFEDLHWSDVSTLDWLASVARRHERARLLIIGTYRPVEVLTRDHPLKGVKQELQLHGRCEELALDFLTEEHVAEYLRQRFNVGAHGRAPLQRVAHVIHQRTDGNPLFMVNVTNELVSRGMIVEKEGQWALPKRGEDLNLDVPENLRQSIEQQIERVSPEKRAILEAASVVGAEFSAAAVAAGADKAVEEIEECCDTLARREQFLRALGTTEWPDGTVAACYGFVHALYQEVLYEQISASRRIRLHRQIGEREETGYREQAREIAAELAVHFERSRDTQRAVQYLEQAGQNALRRNAHQEAIAHLAKGLELLKTLPDTPERSQQEIRLQLTLGPSLMATKGLGAPEAERVYIRARDLCEQMGESPQLFRVLSGLWVVYHVQGKLQTSRELGEQLLTLAQRLQYPLFLLGAHEALGTSLLWLGEFPPARVHLEQGISLYDPQKRRSHAFRAVQDPGVDCRSFTAMALWFLGYPDQALKRIHEAVALAQELAHPYSIGYALSHAAIVHQNRREEQATQECAEAAIALCTEHGFPLFLAVSSIERGWALAAQGQETESIAQIRQGLAVYRTTGSGINWPFLLLLLAEAYGKAGQAEEGLTALAEALAVVDKTEERWWEAELYRLKGELTLQSKQVEDKSKTSRRQVKNKSEVTNSQRPTPSTQAEAEAEACFLRAVEIARHQQAKSWELRATTSLARLWQQQGKKQQAHKMLAEVYNWFTEGFDTKDLQEARMLLEALDR